MYTNLNQYFNKGLKRSKQKSCKQTILGLLLLKVYFLKIITTTNTLDITSLKISNIKIVVMI